jgi:hypothetical protein
MAKRAAGTSRLSSPKESPNVNVKKADGGYVVSTWNPKTGEKTLVAKTDREMHAAVNSILGVKK